MPDISLELRPATHAEIEAATHSLLTHSRQVLGMNVEHRPFGLLAYAGTAYAGSIIGKIFLNWLHLDLVWVADAYRGKGLGRKLMERAEGAARAEGLAGIEVWTQSWQAPEFYRRLGYEEFAVIDDFIPGGKRHAFRCCLTQRQRPKPAPSLPEIVREQVQAYFRLHGDALPSSGLYDRLMPLCEKPVIEVALQATGGNQVRAARLLGINRNTLRKKISELGIAL